MSTRRNGIEGRVLAALRTGPSTAKDVAALVSIPQESARQGLARLLRAGKVHVVERKKMPAFGGVVMGPSVNVFALVDGER
jgi:predicted ArsR family transcriptional regulator